ncbi:sugar ABC transporter substrate-binding protein [Steroidobacter agaridevorans]|uniref:Sugar ABC transporter substrate-binding protein n=1 Tax=Steroidobacter agaridevorans TaxID=2695856 RepID=A0A829YBY6_9GAMM|nr:sugar ABC transporter substrate-binding protein [Steroidobacter agaridevorans]GFE80328.1 sugar ABC transporter substrate-binding protein [Steroidobacter agaridevorans]
MTMKQCLLALCAGIATVCAAQAGAVTLTIATVNNGDMIRMQKLAGEFTRQHSDIELRWVTLEENLLRQRVTIDVATQGGQYDVVTVGNYEVPIWAAQDWLVPLEDLGEDFARDDLLPAIDDSLSHDGKLYAAPFYAESALTMYRTDLFERAGLAMPESPTWKFIRKAAERITDRENGVYGICLRGKAGWGENMAFVSTLAHSWGARWFDMQWRPQLQSRGWQAAVSFYVDLLKKYGPPGASTNGFNENLALFQAGKCGMWIDASVAAAFVSDPRQSTVSDDVGFALFPSRGTLENHGNWLWAWSFVIPSASENIEAAKSFVAWATGKSYMQLVAAESGWADVPPGTRQSLYSSAEYRQAAPFAGIVLQAIEAANTRHPSEQAVPYVGGNFVSIAPYQGIGTVVGQQISAAVAGQISTRQALANAQYIAEREMTRARYLD